MTCRYDRETGDYLTDDGDPCRRDQYGDPTHHCTARRTCSLHIGRDELTCARCLGRARTNLAQIVELAMFHIDEEAIESGVESEAANLAGPAADVEAWTWRKVAARQGRAWHVSLVEDDDDGHPKSLLERWQWMISEDYGHERVGGIGEAAAYLDRHLHRIAQDDGQDFALLARELRRCRAHLEAVLRDSRAPERGAPCPSCLDKGLFIRLVREYAHYCEREDCCQIHVTTDELDLWRCPRNKDHWWNPAGYANLIEERRYA